MRGVLLPLFAPISSLRGVGVRTSTLLEKLIGGERVLDLLFFIPRNYIRYQPQAISACLPGAYVALRGRVDQVSTSENRRIPSKIKITDANDSLTITYFQARPDWIRRQFQIGSEVMVKGKITEFQRQFQLVHPDAVIKVDSATEANGGLSPLADDELTPIYGLTKGISQNLVRQLTRQALQRVKELPEWLDLEAAAVIRTLSANSAQIQSDASESETMISWGEALRQVHFPTAAAGDMLTQAQLRLAYDEILSMTLALGMVRNRRKTIPCWQPPPEHQVLQQQLLSSLPFQLTSDQQRSIREIDQDMLSGTRMTRLLLGDVGSGKTIVAFSAVCTALAAGKQVALMVPTELLARQHFATARSLLQRLDLQVRLLLGSTSQRERGSLQHQLALNQPMLIIGTQALLSERIKFTDLGLIIIDEQHRFGVEQRLKLSRHSKPPHLLLLSATPIPRTMLLACYGDIDVSYLRQKPPGRKPVDTRLLPESRRQAIVERLRYALQRNQKAYWICPLVIGETEEVSASQNNIAAVETRFHELKQQLAQHGRVLAMHGKMKTREQQEIMADFLQPGGVVLIASTVVEVGVDVGDADIIIIESAERYGLAQLHQLRGRVGRSERQAYCLLLHTSKLSDVARQRLAAMNEIQDGFKLAEIDLQLRGGGELVGLQQSGFPQTFFFNPYQHHQLLEPIVADAKAYLDRDANLQQQRGQALRQLLQLFDKEMLIEVDPTN